MTQQTYWIGIVFAVIVFAAVFLRLRNSGMKERYATWWLIIALASVIFSVFPAALHMLSHALGVAVPLNLAFFAGGVVLLLLSLRFSVDLSAASEDRRRLVEEIAILRQRVDDLTASQERFSRTDAMDEDETDTED